MIPTVVRQEVTQYVVRLGEIKVTMDNFELRTLHDVIVEVLGLPKIEHGGCGDRLSHGPHVELGKDGVAKFCRGRSFDAT